MNKTKSDNTLLSYTKKQLLEEIRMLEHNYNAQKIANERLSQLMIDYSNVSPDFNKYLLNRSNVSKE